MDTHSCKTALELAEEASGHTNAPPVQENNVPPPPQNPQSLEEAERTMEQANQELERLTDAGGINAQLQFNLVSVMEDRYNRHKSMSNPVKSEGDRFPFYQWKKERLDIAVDRIYRRIACYNAECAIIDEVEAMTRRFPFTIPYGLTTTKAKLDEVTSKIGMHLEIVPIVLERVYDYYPQYTEKAKKATQALAQLNEMRFHTLISKWRIILC